MPERRIATVLMLDVVGSTHVATQLGDVRYRELSSRFNRLVRTALKRYGGREEDHAGDGFFATLTQPDRANRWAAVLADQVRTLGYRDPLGDPFGPKIRAIAVDDETETLWVDVA